MHTGAIAEVAEETDSKGEGGFPNSRGGSDDGNDEDDVPVREDKDSDTNNHNNK
jgi:hypothetical protein